MDDDVIAEAMQGARGTGAEAFGSTGDECDRRVVGSGGTRHRFVKIMWESWPRDDAGTRYD